MSVKVTRHPSVKDGNLSEIYQSMATKNALLKKNTDGFFRITPLVLCRDFICDVYAFDKVGRKFDLYGMTNPKESPDYDAVKILTVFPNKDSKECLEKNISILHEIEKKNGFISTFYEEVEEDQYSFVIQGDKEWLTSYPLLGLYTHLLRVFCYEIKDTKNWIKSFTFNKGKDKKKAEDVKLVESIHPQTWEKILSNLSCLKMKEFCGYDLEKEDKFTIHHNSGIYSIFGDHRELDHQALRENKHWQYFKEQGTWILQTN